MKGKYSKERNEIRELPTMGSPVWEVTHWDWSKFVDAKQVYKNHLVSLRTIPCSPDIKWEDGIEVEEGKNFKIKTGEIKYFLEDMANNNWLAFDPAEIMEPLPNMSMNTWTTDPNRAVQWDSFEEAVKFKNTYAFHFHQFKITEHEFVSPSDSPTAIPLPAIKDEQEEELEEMWNDVVDIFLRESDKAAAIEKFNGKYSLTRK